MTIPLDKDTRKALVRLAETNKDYRLPARIILGLAANRDAAQIAQSVRATLAIVDEWRIRYETEGLRIFEGVLPDDLIDNVPSVDEKDTVEPAAVVTTEPADNPADTAPQTESAPVYEAESPVITPPTERPPAPAPDLDKLVAEAVEEVMGDRPPRRGRPPRTLKNTPKPRGQDPPVSAKPAPVPVTEPATAQAIGPEPALPAESVPVEKSAPVSAESPQVSEPHEPQAPVTSGYPTLPDSAPDTDSPISIGALAAGFDVDMRRSRHISQLARELFDITLNYHKLPAHFRDLLHAAALLHRMAEPQYPQNYANAGCAFVLQYQFNEINTDERQMLAAIIALQLPDHLLRLEPAFRKLDDSQRQSTEILISLFRIALGLDAEDTQQTAILESHEVPAEIDIMLTGASADKDAEIAQRNAELWNEQYGLPRLRFVIGKDADIQQIAEELPPVIKLSHHDVAVDVSNKLRQHYAARFEYLAERVRRNDTGLLVALLREFQRLTGVWLWLLPGTKPRQLFSEDTEWLESLIREALILATIEDRTDALLNETDTSRDDPRAIHGLKTMVVYQTEQAAKAFETLRDALRSRRYLRWLNSVQADIKGTDDNATFASQIGVRAWAYLGELRHLIDEVNAAGMNADLSELLTLEVVETFELDLRLLSDLLLYTSSLLGVEVEQVLQVVEPLTNYVQAWQRMEEVAQYAERLHAEGSSFGVPNFVVEAFAVIMRERANDMRWNLADMWEALEATSFRRALALAVARP